MDPGKREHRRSPGHGTGTGTDEVEADILRAGADDYVTKETDAQRFLARVAAVIRPTRL